MGTDFNDTLVGFPTRQIEAGAGAGIPDQWWYRYLCMLRQLKAVTHHRLCGTYV